MRSLTVSAGDAGQTVMCSACGQRLIVPPPVTMPPTPPPLAPKPVAPRAEGEEKIDANWWMPPPQPKPAPVQVVAKPTIVAAKPYQPKMSSGALVAWIVIGLIFAGLIGLGTYFAVQHQKQTTAVVPAPPAAFAPAPPPAWDPEVRSIVTRAIDQADRDAVSGRLEEAESLYSGVERAAATQPSGDAVMTALLEGAATRHQAVQATLAKANAATKPAEEKTGTALFPNMNTPATKPADWKLHVSPAVASRTELSDERVGEAIGKAVNYMIGRFEPGTHVLQGSPLYRNGLDALCVYALLQAGEALPDDERLDPRKSTMREMLAALDKLKMEASYETYGRGIRALALSLADRKEDRSTLDQDVDWLLKAHKGSAYTYSVATDADHWDNSNTQYGQLGVWAAQDAGISIPSTYWAAVQKHWDTNQAENGQWGYGHGDSSGTLSMTCAGLASLFVAHDSLSVNDENAYAVGRPPFPPALAKGMEWFETGDNAITQTNGGWLGYTLYGIERVGLASGMKFFGRHDWYRELASSILARQTAEGSFGDEVETSYALLFLSRGRHPIMMNKVRFEGAWSNRPRDLANLAHFATHELERPINWQVVSIDGDYQSWSDSPILYLASHQAPHLTAEQIGQIRRYVEAGGLLSTHADGNSKAFNDFAADLAEKLFPDRKLEPMPADHELFSVLYTIEPAPKLMMVSNGVRPLMIHSPVDVSAAWQQRLGEKSHPNQYKLGVNLFLYTSGKGELRNRLAGPLLGKPSEATGGRTSLVRLKYGSDAENPWDPEPAAWPRFATWFQFQTSCAEDISAVPLESLKPGAAPVAHLTGVKAFSFSDADAMAVRNYVDGGGTLLLDAAGGSNAFAESAGKLVEKAFADKSLEAMPASHPVLNATSEGMEDLSQPLLRAYALHKLGPRGAVGAIEYLEHGKGRVIYTKLDLTAGLLGTNTWGILGFHPNYAEAFVKNVVLWAAARTPEKK